ncbi:MAG: FAD-dependent oxidoreductase [Thermoanaerobaculaceae bacterium]|nr:FAD-dependent oxidoreductase [Thermoanaerobaculaceae bacterium]MDI9620414.1 FAD-dependent oxidoreductase [Acidobacteriota bacterium]NLH12361.1 FAD-dependent oxidoreductase [Holophagae bacterium]HPW55098.1 FAD-dependent oxidoreductase [Thermoanaerobaculaceae bacterium]
MSENERYLLTDAQLRAELARCESCAEKPCQAACPADCSPADFIMAARVGEPSDYRRAAAMILSKNPLGGVCGWVCPDTHCQHACSRRTFDRAIEIPAIQATLIAKARELGWRGGFGTAPASGQRVAIVGAGPAGYGAAAVLAQEGHAVELFETAGRSGGMAALIPEYRLDPAVLAADLAFVETLGDVKVRRGEAVESPEVLLQQGFDAVVVTTGLDEPLRLGIPGEEVAILGLSFLRAPDRHPVLGRRVAVIGGGAVAADCAEIAVRRGAARVEMLVLESLAELPLTPRELRGLMTAGVHLSGRTRVTGISVRDGLIVGLDTCKVQLPDGVPFHPRHVKEVPGTEQSRPDFDLVLVAIGARSALRLSASPGVFSAGDLANGPTTVVEAVAAGKNTALAVHAFLQGAAPPGVDTPVKSWALLRGYDPTPVPLGCDFFGRPILSPFLLSAAPPTDGYEQMRRAYEAGWAGGVMKTAFDNVPIHIPARYMFALTPSTYANCDNVSGHPLDRVCREVERLRREFPDRLTLASTGGPVTGNAELDALGWQSNTAMLERAGVCGIEYSLSCPQGGDGTKGDIVSQDPELTAAIIDWVMQVGDPEVPKLFKLTAAVTSIYPIMAAVTEVFARYPGKRAGVTLANTFPTLAFRPGTKTGWEEGIVVGMSGEGVIPISNLTLANVSRLGVVVSGNGGPMDYKAAANFLALGARTVQLCTVVMKYGYEVVRELHSGLSYLLAERGIGSVAELIGRALPNPITGFMELPATKPISAVHEKLCHHCGNCTRCPYLAITLDERKVPRTDAERCIGCSICAQKCFAGALYMRERTADELAALKEV